jgi:hypothetical protein
MVHHQLGALLWGIIICASIFATLGSGSVISWKHDNIVVTNTTRTLVANAQIHHYVNALNMTIHANGPINNDGGSFRLVVSVNVTQYYDANHHNIYARSVCMDTSIGETEFIQTIQSTPVQLTMHIPYGANYPKTIDDLFLVRGRRYFSKKGTNVTRTAFHAILDNSKFGNYDIINVDKSLSNWRIASLSVNFVTDGCARMRTVGHWNDASQWIGGVVPSSSSNVIFPNNSGVVVLDSNVSVTSLQMYGGYILAHKTECPTGWSAQPGNSHR